MVDCKLLLSYKERIEKGEDPMLVIPYHINADKDTLLEIYYYAIQVLPEGRRKEETKKAIEMINASR